MKTLLQKIRSIFKIARLMSSDDSGDFQQGTFFYMGSAPVGQIFIPYGDLMRPPDDAQLAVFAQNGNSSNAIAFASDPKNRTVKDLAPGEKGIANYISGSYILIRNNGDIEIVGTANVIANITGNATVTAPDIILNGDVTINGDLVNNGITFETHIHSQDNDSDGDSEADTDAPKNP